MFGNKVVEAVLRLSAKLGSLKGFDTLSGKLSDVDAKSRKFNRSQTVLANTHKNLRNKLLATAAPAALALGANAAFDDFAEIERRLTRIGINADESKERMAEVMGDMRRIANEAHTPVAQIVDGLESLIASGKSLDEALALLPSVARTAQASDSSFGAMAVTADTLSGSLGIAADQMENAFDIIAYGGKAGKFELRDMAQQLPSLGPAFAALGYEGEEGLKRLVAALQTVRKDTGTSGEAATAFMDVLSKMETNTMANNFKRFGVDLREEMKSIRDSGEDVLEGFIRISQETVNGDLSKLPQLFTDKQMLIGMRALINRTGEYNDLVIDLSNSLGTVAKDIKRIGDDGQASIDKMSNSWRQLKESMGQAVAPVATEVMDTVSGALNKDQAIRNSPYWKNASLADRTFFTFQKDAEERDQIARSGGYVVPGDEKLAAQDPAMYRATAFATMPARINSAPPSLYQGPTGGLADLNSNLGINVLEAYEKRFGGQPAQEVAGLENVEQKLQEGGSLAAQEISDGAPESGAQFGNAATETISSGAAAAGAAFGDAAAQRILQASNAAAKQLSGAAARRANRNASGNPGRTMTDAGVAE